MLQSLAVVDGSRVTLYPKGRHGDNVPTGQATERDEVHSAVDKIANTSGVSRISR